MNLRDANELDMKPQLLQDIKSNAKENTKTSWHHKILIKLVRLTIPALYNAGGAEFFKSDAINRLKLLLKNPTDYIKPTAKLFELDEKILTSILEEIQQLTAQPNEDKKLAEAIAELSTLYEVEINKYVTHQPTPLEKLQAEMRKKINATIKPPKAKLSQYTNGSLNEDEERLSGYGQENLIIFDEVQFAIPNKIQMYRKMGWKPPQVFIDSIMDKGKGYVFSHGSGHIFAVNTAVTQDVIENIKELTAKNALFYVSRYGRRHYTIGSFTSIKAPNGTIYDVDPMRLSNTNQNPFCFSEAIFVEYGKIIWQGNDVTTVFWDRVAAIQSMPNYTFGARFRLPKYEKGQKHFPTFLSLIKKPCSLNNEPTMEPFFEDSNIHPLDGLVSIDSNREGFYISAEIIQSIANVIPAVNGEVIRRHKRNANIVIENTDGKFFKNSWESVGFPAGLAYLIDKENEDIFENEKNHGKQGIIIDRTLSKYHSKFNFACEEDVEKAIHILADPNRQIINPLDIYVRGNVIYLAGAVNQENLALLKGNALPSTDAKRDVKKEDSPVSVENKKNLKDALFNYFNHFIGIGTNTAFLNTIDVTETQESTSFNFQFSVGNNFEEKARSFLASLLLKTALLDLLKIAGITCCNDTVQRWQSGTTSQIIITTKIKNKDIQIFKNALIPSKNNYRFHEFVRATIQAIDMLGDKDKLAGPYVSFASTLMPCASIKAYQMQVLNSLIESSLIDAAERSNEEEVKCLLKLTNYPNPAKAIEVVTKHGKNNILKIMLNSGVDPNCNKSLIVAAMNNQLDTIKLLLTAGGVDAGMKTGTKASCCTALSAAAEEGHGDIVKFLLLTQGVHDVSYTDYDINDGNQEIIYRKKDIDDALRYIDRMKRESRDYTEDEAIDLAKLLIDAGANVNYVKKAYPIDDYCLGNVLKQKKFKLAAYLVERGASYYVGNTVARVQKEEVEQQRKTLSLKGTEENPNHTRYEKSIAQAWAMLMQVGIGTEVNYMTLICYREFLEDFFPVSKLDQQKFEEIGQNRAVCRKRNKIISGFFRIEQEFKQEAIIEEIISFLPCMRRDPG